MIQTQNKKYVISSYEDGTILAIRIGERAFIRAADASEFTDLTFDAVVTLTGPDEILAIYDADIVNPTGVGAECYVDYQWFRKILRLHRDGPDIAKALRPFKRWIQREVLGYSAMIASGASVSARLLQRALGSRKLFMEWSKEVADRNPKLTVGTGFNEEIWSDTDFQVPLSLAETIAQQTETFAGMVVSFAIRKSGFHMNTLLHEPFAVTLQSFSGLIFRSDDLVEAHKLHALLEVEDPFEEWISLAVMDSSMEWGINYFSETEIDFQDFDQLNHLQGDLLLSSEIVNQIIISESPMEDEKNPCYSYHYLTSDAILPTRLRW